MRSGFWFCVKSSAGFLLAVSVLGAIFAPEIVAFFRNDPQVIATGSAALRFQCLTFTLSAWVVMSNMMLQTTGDTVPATLLAMARQGIFFIPSVILLPHFLGLLGILMSQPVADVLSLALAIPLQLRALGRMKEPLEQPQS